jgi:hypothetical protein
LQLVTEIFPAYFPSKASLVIASFAALPDPLMSMCQGDTEPVSKLPLVNNVAGSALKTTVVLMSVKARSKRMKIAWILEVLFCSARAKFLPRDIASTGVLSPNLNNKH